MKHRFLLFLFLLSSIAVAAEQDKRVFITLDVSGSMQGNKYVLANYTTQMIMTLCGENDEIHLIVYGREKRFSKKSSSIKTIQKRYGSLSFGNASSSESQFDDILGFNRVYEPSDKKQDWLFIIGDGIWSTMEDRFKKGRERFGEIVESGTVNVCFLQTGEQLSEHSDFTKFVSTFGVVDIEKADVTVPTIMKGCDHFARKILGFSETSLQIKKKGDHAILIKTELPLKEFFLVCQDQNGPDDLPKIVKATAGGAVLNSTLKGTPTTVPLRTELKEKILSGHVYHVGGSGTIRPQTEIEVVFDKNVNPDNICVYPIVEDLNFGSMSLTRLGDNLKRLDSRTSTICRDENKAIVRIELGEKSSQKLPESLLKKTKVVVKANNKDYAAQFKNGCFECEIDLIDDETPYYAECDCPGYFKRVTPIAKIVKGDCDEKPVEMEVEELPITDLGTISFERLKNDAIAFTIKDSLTHQALNPDLFDVTFEVENDYLYEKPVMHVENDSLIVLELRPKGEWCECLFPEKLNIKMVSTPKNEAFEEYGKVYRKTVIPIQMTVVKDEPWLSRCLWLIILLVVLLLLFFYFRSLLRKKRFKKGAMVTPTYYSYYGKKIEDQGGTMLRKEGFGAWFARWFLPFDERNSLYWDMPTASISFVAADSMEVVNVPKENITKEMKVDGYNPKNDTAPKTPIKLGNGGKIRIKKPDGSEQGYLVFTCGEQTDGRLYRVLLLLLQVVVAAAFCILLYLLVRSFF